MGTEESKALMRRITEEIWNQGRLDLIPRLISDVKRGISANMR